MSSRLIVDGTIYDVPVLELQRTADILDKSAHRSEDGVLHREVIGTYYNYTLKIGRVKDKALYENLFQVLSAPVASHEIELPNDHVKYEAYCSSIKDEVQKVYEDEVAEYKNLTCKFTAMAPARKAGKA